MVAVTVAVPGANRVSAPVDGSMVATDRLFIEYVMVPVLSEVAAMDRPLAPTVADKLSNESGGTMPALTVTVPL